MGAGGPLRVNAGLVLPPDDLKVEFARSGGPGGQNVNKVETKVILRFSIPRSRALEERQRERLRIALTSRITLAGEIIVRADRFRDRTRNLEDARERLAALLAEALIPPQGQAAEPAIPWLRGQTTGFEASSVDHEARTGRRLRVKPDLEAAIRAVEALAGRRASATRHDARPILLSIGGSLRAGRPEELGDAADRLKGLPEPVRSSWVAAIGDELSMACTEYVRSVDPRFLNHPRYDLAYTLQSRLELEVRWRACEHLEHRRDHASTSAVERADALLEARTGTKLHEWLSKHGVDAAP